MFFSSCRIFYQLVKTIKTKSIPQGLIVILYQIISFNVSNDISFFLSRFSADYRPLNYHQDVYLYDLISPKVDKLGRKGYLSDF